jgi:alpha-tubulin suppressor-like RCC1 family protein
MRRTATRSGLALALIACGGRAAPPVDDPRPGKPPPAATSLEDIVLSSAGTCGHIAGGFAVCWGEWGDELLKVSVPAAGLSEVAELEIGHDFLEDPQQHYHDHFCVRDRQGAVQCWGNGHHGQLGSDAGDGTPTPTAVPGLPPIAQLALGAHHSCALDRAGQVWCWGSNQYGQAGIGKGPPTVARPTVVAGLGKITQLVAAMRDTCALADDREVYCWGENQAGTAGAPDAGNSIVWTPYRVTIASDSDQISGSYTTLCARKRDGKVVCWGYLTDQLGSAFEKRTTGDVPDISDAVQVATGYAHACAIRGDGSLWCWGKDDVGQLGDGGGRSAASPVAVALPGHAVAVVAGRDNTCARIDDRRWYCWGANRHGEIGPRRQSTIASPTALDLSQVELVSQ